MFREGILLQIVCFGNFATNILTYSFKKKKIVLLWKLRYLLFSNPF